MSPIKIGSHVPQWSCSECQRFVSIIIISPMWWTICLQSTLRHVYQAGQNVYHPRKLLFNYVTFHLLHLFSSFYMKNQNNTDNIIFKFDFNVDVKSMAFPNKAQQNDVRQSLPPITGIYPTMNMMLGAFVFHYFYTIQFNSILCWICITIIILFRQAIQQPVKLDRDHRTSIKIITKIIEHRDKIWKTKRIP